MLRAGRTPFVGRERELAFLLDRLRAAGDGDGGVVLLSGEPGIGKTRLLAELGERARREGWLVLRGRAYETDGLPPYIPFIEALSDWVRACTDEDLQAQIGGSAADIAMLVPEIGNRLHEPPSTPERTSEVARYYLFESVTTTLARIARSSTGLVLVLDDLHWADGATLLLLEHLARRLFGAPMLVAGAYRRGRVDRAHPLTATLAALAREGVLEQAAIGPFEPEETVTAIEVMAGVVRAPSVVHALIG